MGNIEEIIILRQLTNAETFLELSHQHSGYILSRSFIINSKIDLFNNKETIDKAIKYWKQLHPLLRCNIKKMKNNNFYFVHNASNNAANSFNSNNIRYLYYVQEQDKKQDKQESIDYWKYIFENELNRPFNSSNELLWRLIFIKLDDSKYCIQFTIHHVITDGLNVYSIILELVSIIENLYLKKEVLLDDYNICNSIFEYNYPNDPRRVYVDNHCKLDFDVKFLQLPLSLDCNNKDINDDSDSLGSYNGSFYNDDGSKYISIKTIRDDRINNLSATKFNVTESDVTCMLLDKCRKHDVKLTTCLDMIIGIALRQSIKRLLNGNSHDQQVLKSLITINMRPFLQPKLNNSVMGFWVNEFTLEIDKEVNQQYEESDFWKTTFWQITKRKCDQLHEYLKNKTFLTKESLEFYEKLFLKFINEHMTNERDSFLESYTFTNLGVLPSKYDDDDESLNMIEIMESYAASSFHIYNIYKFASFAISTINGRLLWTICYDRKFLRNTVVDYWIETINSIILNYL